MSDNLRRYRALRAPLIQEYPDQPTGRAWRCWGYTVHSGRMAHIPLPLVVERVTAHRKASAGEHV